MTTTPDENAPFADLLRAAWLFHPEAAPTNLEMFRQACHDAGDQLDEHPTRLKHQLQQALNGHDADLDYDKLDRNSAHDVGSDYIFLRQMWVSIFPTEPIPGPPQAPFDAAISIGELYYANPSDPDDNTGHPDQLKAHLALPPAEQGALLRAVKTDLALVIAGATAQMPRGGLNSHVYGPRGVRGNNGIARALWYDLYPHDPIPGEEHHGPAGQRTDLWPK